MLADYDWCDDAPTPHQRGRRGGGWESAKQKKSTSLADVLTFPTFAPFFGVKTESQNFLLNVQCFI